MVDCSKKVTLGTIWNLIYPAILSAIFWFILVIKLKFNFDTNGYSDVLDSIINFSSIIIGFYTAMYGVMIGFADSDIFKILRKNRTEGYLKFQLYDSLICSFIILLLSIIMQVLTKQVYNIYTSILFNLWTISLGYFIGTSFRSISLLLKMMFHHDSTVEDLTEEQKEKRARQKDELKRP